MLAAIDLDADGAITAIDNCSCRRMVVSAASFWWRCSGLAITGVTVSKKAGPGAKNVNVTVRGHGLEDIEDISLVAAPGLSFDVKEHKVSPRGILTLVVDVPDDAEPGPRTLRVTTEDGSFATFPGALTVPDPSG